MLLKRLLTDDPTPHAGDTLDAFWPKHTAWVESLELPIDRAIIGSLRADRVGFAFVAGYRAALYALAPAVGRHELVALSATEAGGNHPRAIHTKLENGRLSGRKRWTTLGGRAASVLVVASVGQDDTGRNRLKVARVPVDRAGVRVVPMGDAPFVPEIPHAELYFDDVEVRDDELLPGDGYLDYLKPFRTVEDLHVHGALLGHLVGVARRNAWPREAIEELLSLISSVRALAHEPPLSPATHIALAGVLAATSRCLERIAPCWSLVDDETRSRWERDRVLLTVAQKARDARRDAAWKHLHEN